MRLLYATSTVNILGTATDPLADRCVIWSCAQNDKQQLTVCNDTKVMAPQQNKLFMQHSKALNCDH